MERQKRADFGLDYEKLSADPQFFLRLLLHGAPDTYVYLLVKPASAPTERVIVPILRKKLSDFEKNSEE
ncbi:MAG: hypothetical protein VB980_07310 [Opitutales bacterium]